MHFSILKWVLYRLPCFCSPLPALHRPRFLLLSTTITKFIKIMRGNAGFAQLFVRFDRPSVVGGNSMSGTVCLSVDHGDVAGTSICCKITGCEVVRIGSPNTPDDSPGSSSTMGSDPTSASHKFFEMSFILGRVSGTKISKGHYAYPFSFTVPANVPSSMAASLTAGESVCCVSYTMDVCLNGTGRQKVSTFVNFTVVRPGGSAASSPFCIEPASVDVNSFCCFKKGNVLLGGSGASDLLNAGSNAAVKCAAQNHSTAQIKAIEVSLDQTVHFRAGKSEQQKNKVLCRTRVSPEQAGLSLGVLSQQREAGYDAVNDLRTLAETLATASKSVEITIPADAKSSFNGKLIQVKHDIRITLITEFGTSNPFVEHAVQVVSMSTAQATNRYASQMQSPPLPKNWRPITAPRASFPESDVPVAQVGVREGPSSTNALSAKAAGEEALSFADLLEAIRRTRDACGQLRTYLCQGHHSDDLQPEELYQLFQAIESGTEQLRVAEILAVGMTGATCVKVARAIAGTKDACKREVAELLLTAGPVLDKAENARLVQSELSAEQWEVVEKYLL